MGLDPLRLPNFSFELAGYDGDLLSHMPESERNAYKERACANRFTVDTVVKLAVAQPHSFEVQHDYTGFSRPTIVHEHADQSLPKAVVFRDSTAQFLVTWMAEHFSRSVFIWHEGHVIQDVIEHEQPDMVIQIMAERFVWNYPSRIPMVSMAMVAT